MSVGSESYSGRVRVRSCGFILKDKALLLVRLDTPTRPNHVWMPPGGEVQAGELLEQTLRREVYEETGIRVEPQRLAMVHEFMEPPWHALEFYFLCTGSDLAPVLGRDPERDSQAQILKDVRYQPIEILQDLDLYPETVYQHRDRLFAREGPVIYTRSTNLT